MVPKYHLRSSNKDQENDKVILKSPLLVTLLLLITPKLQTVSALLLKPQNDRPVYDTQMT